MAASRQRERRTARGGGLRPAARTLALVAAAALLCGGPPWPAAHAADAPADAAAPGAAAVRQIRQGTPHEALYDVAFDGPRGIAVGAFGSVLDTIDGGTTWQAQSFPMRRLALLSVAMRQGKCIAVGQTGLIYASGDCKTWKAAPSNVKTRLLAVDLNRHGLAYAVGAFGTILQSSDWGQTWAVQTVDWTGITEDGAEPHLYDVHVGDDGVVTAVGEFELVLRAGDGGKRWKALRRGERSLFALSVLADGRMYAAGQSGALLSSADGGTTWQSLKTGTEAILTGIQATRQGEVLASGINAMVFSRDGGASWKPVASKLVRNARYQALGLNEASGGKRRMVAVGAGGSILELEL